jgi:hypothetical protein
MAAVLGVIALGIASPDIDAAGATSRWLTLTQAKRAVQTYPAPLIFCEVDRVGNDACPVGSTPLTLEIRAAVVRGFGPPRVFNGIRKWRQFHVSASCGTDRFSGRTYNAAFLWSLHAGRRTVETTSPADPALTGVAHPGCRSRR